MTRQDCYELGKILKTHSFRGEYQISFNNQFEKILEDSESIFVEVDGLLVPFFFEYIQINTNTNATVKFDHISSEAQAAEFVGCSLHILKTAVTGKFKNDDEELIGFEVVDNQLGNIGTITEVIEIPQNNLYNIQGKDAEYLIPANPDFITKIETKKKMVFTALPDGILNISD